MTKEKLTNEEKIGVLTVFVGPQRELLLVPPAKENLLKHEVVFGSGDGLKPIGNKLEAVSGGINENESFREGIVREAREERSLILGEDQVEQFPLKMRVIQKNGGDPVNFSVAVGVTRLTEDQILELGNEVVIISDGDIADYVKNNKHLLRPSLVSALQQLIEGGVLK